MNETDGWSYEDIDVAELAELRSVTLAEMFPSLVNCKTMMIEDDQLGTRALNCLRRKRFHSWADIAALSVGDIWMLPNVGRQTVEQVLAASREVASQYQESWIRDADGNEHSEESAPLPLSKPTPQRDAVTNFFELFTEWAIDATGATTVGEVLRALNGPLPSELSIQYAEVSDYPLTDVSPSANDLANSGNLIVDFLEAIGSDAHLIVERDIASPSGRRPTLESLATREGVTKERVRQRIKRDLERAAQLRGLPTYRLLSWRAETLRNALGSVCSISAPSTVQAIRDASRGFVDPVGCGAEEFMLWFASEYRDQDGYWVSGEFGDVKSVLHAAQIALESDWLLPEQRLEEILSHVGLKNELTDDDVAMFTAWRSIGDQWWVRWDGSVGDKAEHVLRLSLRAMDSGEVNKLIGGGHADSSIQNVLSSDDRFSRISMDLRFALAEWGWEEYSSAAKEIAERIERAGGEAVLTDIIIELSNQFGLKESTIRAFAATPAFVLKSGRIRLRDEDEPKEVNDRISSAKGLYVRPDGCVVFNIQVDEDVLRGSGRPIPNPLAVALGVLPGTTRDFSAGDVGRIRVSWPITSTTGAAIGSTRSLAERCDAKEGDALRLVFDHGSETVIGSVVSGESLTELTGLTLTPGEEVAQLSLALRVTPTEVHSVLNERGDGIVASLLPVTQASPGFDEALSGLEGLLG